MASPRFRPSHPARVVGEESNGNAGNRARAMIARFRECPCKRNYNDAIEALCRAGHKRTVAVAAMERNLPYSRTYADLPA